MNHSRIICLYLQTLDMFPEASCLGTDVDHSCGDEGNTSIQEFKQKFHDSFRALQRNLADFSERQQQSNMATQQYLGKY